MNKTNEFILAIKKPPEIEIDWEKALDKEYYISKAKIQAQLEALRSRIADEVFAECFDVKPKQKEITKEDCKKQKEAILKEIPELDLDMPLYGDSVWFPCFNAEEMAKVVECLKDLGYTEV